MHDAAGLLTPEQRASLEPELAAFESETSNQIVVATFPSLEGESLEDFSIRLAEAWKIGQKGRDNGIILLIFPAERLARIEVGYGLEAAVPDAYASRVIEERLKPAFRREDYYGGIRSSVEALMAASRGVYDTVPKTERRSDNGFSWFWLLILLLLFLPFGRRRRRRRGSLFWGALAGLTLGGMGGRRGGWGGGSGWGGGVFGGGGGSFGGGGASGRW